MKEELFTLLTFILSSSTDNYINNAERAAFNTNELKSCAARFVSRAAIEMVIKERDREEIEHVEEEAENSFRADVLKQCDCSARPDHPAELLKSFLRRGHRAEDQCSKGRIERGVREGKFFGAGLRKMNADGAFFGVR